MKKRNFLQFAALGLLSALTGGLVAGCSQSKPAFAAIDITGADYARDFSLTDHNGQPRTLKDFAGKVVVMFFGYTQCADVCPTTMAELAEVRRLLGQDGARVQGLFVSVDPQRDTPEVLKAYMENFDPTFLALYTTPEKLVDVAKEYKVYYKKVEGPTPTSYTMDHSAGSYVYDSHGKLRLFTRYGSGAQLLANDLKILLQQVS
jgi:protein SCO1/2